MDVGNKAQGLQPLLLTELLVQEGLEMFLSLIELAQAITSFSIAPQVLALLQLIPTVDSQPQLHKHTNAVMAVHKDKA